MRAAAIVLLLVAAAPATTPAHAQDGPRVALPVDGPRVALPVDGPRVALPVDGPRVALPVDGPRVALLHGDGSAVDAATSALTVSHSITNDGTLVRGEAWNATSADPDDVRVEVTDASSTALSASLTVESVDPVNGHVRTARELRLSRPRAGVAFRSPYLRLVGDAIDAEAPGVSAQVLVVALRDVVRVTYGQTRAEWRVGRSGAEGGELGSLRARLVVHLVRNVRGGAPPIGRNEVDAVRIARDQVRIANEVWLQCLVTFGSSDEADVRVEDPPPPWLLAIGDDDGLPAAGGGSLRLRVDGHALTPVTTRAGALPVETALDVAAAARAAGFRATVIESAATENGAGRSADVLVRTREGRPATLSADGTAPLSSDPRQLARIGFVDLADGLTEFDNMNATAGSLEERTLIRALEDGDPGTIDLFIVDRFALGTRQGEAFIEGDGSGAIANVVVLDRNGLLQQLEAWTQSHEVGHVLLDQPYHPDNVGPDRPWLLMDADSSAGLVTGPKRLSRDECVRARRMSGPDSVPSLLTRSVP